MNHRKNGPMAALAERKSAKNKSLVVSKRILGVSKAAPAGRKEVVSLDGNIDEEQYLFTNIIR